VLVFLVTYFETNGHFDSNVKLFPVIRKLSAHDRFCPADAAIVANIPLADIDMIN
jgi:hypothetical protein